MILVDVNVLFYSTLSPEIVHAWGDHHILIDLYTVFPIGKRAIIFTLFGAVIAHLFNQSEVRVFQI